MQDLTVNPQLIILVLTLVFSTWFVFLDVCSRLSVRNSIFTHAFWILGPVFLGLPVWAIYFITRLSIDVPILINQHWSQVVLTIVIAMSGCLLACLVVVLFANRIVLQIVFSMLMAVLFSSIHFLTLHIEGHTQGFYDSETLRTIFLLGTIAIFVLLRVAAFLKDSSYVRHVFSAIVVMMLTGVMFLLGLPKLLLVYSVNTEIHDVPLFDNIAFGYAAGLTAFTLLVMLMVGVWFSRTHTLTSKPTKALRLGILIIALSMVAIVTTSRWLIEHTLSQDITAMYMLDDAEHETDVIVSDLEEISSKEGNYRVLSIELQRLVGTVIPVRMLVQGGVDDDGVSIKALRDPHMVDDLKTYIFLVDSLLNTVGEKKMDLPKIMDGIDALNAIVMDVQSDIRIAINNDRTMLAWSNYAISFILVMMFIAFSWLISRGWYAIETKNKQLETLVAKRTEEMAQVLNDMDVQVSNLAANNAKISILNEALGELRDCDHLYDEGEHEEFYKLVLLNVIRVIDATVAYYAVYNEAGTCQMHYIYGNSRLRGEVEAMFSSPKPGHLNERLKQERVSLNIENIHKDRITLHDFANMSLLKSFIGVPVIVDKRVAGIFGFFNKENAPSFTDDDEILINIFSSHLAHALERHSFLRSKTRQLAEAGQT